MPYYHTMDYYPFMGFWTGLVWLIVIIVVAYLIYKLIKSEKILAPQTTPIKSAADILDERYAKGELTREQYVQMKDDLKKSI
jgi:putative membrane protein